MDPYPLLIAGLSQLCLLTFSTYGSSVALFKFSNASVFHINKRGMIAKAYFATGMAISVYFFALILSFVLSSKITKDIEFVKSMRIFTASLVYGIVALFIGRSMGNHADKLFEAAAKTESLNISFFLLLGMYELLLLFALVIAILGNK